jgi:peptidyl-prolyl cis-trans isomerase SurA
MAVRLQPASSASQILVLACVAACASARAFAQAEPSATTPVVLDRVVAVVNNQTILSSDLDNEIRLSILDPSQGSSEPLSRQHALDQLISRALIEQQMRQEDIQAALPSQAEVDARLTEIRRELPACARASCNTDNGWQAFLSSHQLTQPRVDRYLRNRIEVLRFIEQRFRQGIRISPQEVDDYYRKTLLPQYAPGTQPPPLDRVAARIEEILLQQQVSALFDDWLKSLRRQGEIEILDPALESADPQLGSGSGLE